MKNLVTFVGFKSSGKNTAAEALFPFDYVPFSFADALKDSLATIFCWDRELLEGITRESRIWREQKDEWWADRLGIPYFTPRWAMQNFGTEVMRVHFHDQVWVYNVERRMLMLDERKSVVLIDARFPNEIALAKRYGGEIIRIRRGPDPAWMGIAEAANMENSMTPWDEPVKYEKMMELGIHPSEWRWIGSDIDAVIENDGSIALLQERVRLELNLETWA
jgi:hypothetical protein